MKKIFVLFGLLIVMFACKSQTFYTLIKNKYDDYYRYSRVGNLREADKAMRDLVAYSTLISLYMLEHGEDSTGYLPTLESSLESWSRTTLSTPIITYNTTTDNIFNTVLLDSASFDEGTTYYHYIVDSAGIISLINTYAADAGVDTAATKNLAIDTTSTHTYDTLRSNMYLIGTEFKVTQRDNNSFYSIIMANEGHAQDSLVVEFGEEEVHLYLASQDSVGLKIYADSIQLNINGDKITWDGTYWRTATDTTAWLSDLLAHTSDVANPHTVTKTQVGLSAVTNHAQLKRDAADFYSFTQKTTPVNADVLLIEDSENSYNKKKVLWSQLPTEGGGGTGITAQEAIDTVEDAKFSGIETDTSYVWSYLKIGNGRDSLIYCDIDDQGGFYTDMWADNNFIYSASSTANGGLKTYSVDKKGTLSFIDSDYQGGDYFDVVGDGTYIYVTMGASGLGIYSVDSDGVLTFITSDDQGGIYRGIWYSGPADGYNKTADASYFVFVAAGDNGLYVYQYDSEDEVLDRIDSDHYSTADYYKVWGDGTYIYVTTLDDGILQYTVSDEGELSLASQDDQGGNYTSVWGDGTYIYVACEGDGLRVYEIVDESISYIGAQDDGDNYKDVWCDQAYVYTACWSSGIRAYYADDEGTLTLLHEDDSATAFLGGDYNYIWGNKEFIYIGYGLAGMGTYSLYEYAYFEDALRLRPLGHLPANAQKGQIVCTYAGYYLGYDGSHWDTLNVPETGAVSERAMSFVCTLDSIAEVADSSGYGVVTANFTGMELVDVQVRSFTNTGRIVSVYVRRIRSATIDDMLSTPATLGSEYTVSDEVINTSYDDVAAGDLIYIYWTQTGGGTRHKGLFVGLDFE